MTDFHLLWFVQRTLGEAGQSGDKRFPLMRPAQLLAALSRPFDEGAPPGPPANDNRRDDAREGAATSRVFRIASSGSEEVGPFAK